MAPASLAAAEALGRSVPELAAFQDEPPQMRSGAVGKAGFLHLGFARRGRRTILADLDYRIPYRAQRALYCDEAMPDLAHVFLITTTGCLLQGDRMALDIALGQGARAHITTLSHATADSRDGRHEAKWHDPSSWQRGWVYRRLRGRLGMTRP